LLYLVQLCKGRCCASPEECPYKEATKVFLRMGVQHFADRLASRVTALTLAIRGKPCK
jgi:hypothetical protein